MTKLQRKQHKIGNQIRKAIILKSKYQHALGGVIQNGKYNVEIEQVGNKFNWKLK